MTWQGWAEIALTLALTLSVAWPVGIYLARVLQGSSTWLDPVLGPVARLIYRGLGPEAVRSQTWIGYTAALLAFNAAGFGLLYAVLLLQGALPLNPLKLAGLTPDLAFNTAIGIVSPNRVTAILVSVSLCHGQIHKPIPLLRQLAGGHPARCDDVRPLPTIAPKRRRPAVRARHRHLP